LSISDERRRKVRESKISARNDIEIAIKYEVKPTGFDKETDFSVL